MAIKIYTTIYRAKKGYYLGTHRLCSPEETLERLAPEKERIGLTRNADITGLDRIGIPVTAAIRPNGRTLSVSSGKGVTKKEAVVSGFMEALELYQAETYHFKTLRSTYQELKTQYSMPHPTELSMRKNGIFLENWPLTWSFGWDLISQREVPLPLAALSLNYHRIKEDPFDLGAFEVTSNGLASGNHLLEALCSALYEVIERDGISRDKNPPKIDLKKIPFDSVNSLLEKLSDACITSFLFDCTSKIGIYVFKATIFDQKDQRLGMMEGYGAHLDPEVAMIRALTEAAQSRAIFVAGARDDIFNAHYQSFQLLETEPFLKKLENAPSIDPFHFVSLATPTFEGDCALILERLKKASFTSAIVYDLSSDVSPVKVVRVVVPGLKFDLSHRSY